MYPSFGCSDARHSKRFVFTRACKDRCLRIHFQKTITDLRHGGYISWSCVGECLQHVIRLLYSVHVWKGTSSHNGPFKGNDEKLYPRVCLGQGLRIVIVYVTTLHGFRDQLLDQIYLPLGTEHLLSATCHVTCVVVNRLIRARMESSLEHGV